MTFILPMRPVAEPDGSLDKKRGQYTTKFQRKIEFDPVYVEIYQRRYAVLFVVSGGFQFGPTKEDYRMLWLARTGLALAAVGFILQIIGVLQQ